MLTTRLALKSGLLGLALLAAAIAPSAAFAEERTCRGTLRAVTVDNLRVPQDATCELIGTYVKGTVKVERNATLIARGVRVVGNVQAENAKNVTITYRSSSGVTYRSRIGGSVQVKQGGAATVTSSRITGDIQYDANRRYLKANGNNVGGSIQVVGNSGGAEIFRNVVNGNLQCKENSPAPTGGGNIVGGNKEDQCARF
jgi:hypothetical protein